MRRIPLKDVSAPPESKCGGCTLCCTVMGVSDLPPNGKDQGETCRYEQAGCGCAIYATRPPSCAHFQCLWVKGEFGAGDPQYRPDRLHAVPVRALDGINILLHEDAAHRGVARATLAPFIDRFIAHDDCFVQVICGDEREFRGSTLTELRYYGKQVLTTSFSEWVRQF
jgi:hypothetical protein